MQLIIQAQKNIQKSKFKKLSFLIDLKEVTEIATNFNKKAVSEFGDPDSKCTFPLVLSLVGGTVSRVLLRDLRVSAGTYGHKSPQMNAGVWNDLK